MGTSNKIKKINALEILDSRGIPTVGVTVELASGIKATAKVPSGTSSGRFEDYELRDGDKKRFGGKGVLKAVGNVNKEIFVALKNRDVMDLATIDQTMINLDGTQNKSRLGANAILGVSMACARAGAYFEQLSLYKYLRAQFPVKLKNYRLPQAMFNLVNGGRHADSGMDVQEFMLVPQEKNFEESLKMAAEVFYQLKKILQLGGFSTGVGAEGGFAPKFKNSEQAIEVMMEAARSAGIKKKSYGIALDVASSEFYSDTNNEYQLKREKKKLSRNQIITWYKKLVQKYPIIAIEDGLHEDDFDGWTKLNKQLGKKIKIVGDDFTVTNPRRLKKAIQKKSLNALIIKPNQIGTVTETLETVSVAKKNKIATVISHRSGDTTDPFIADLAVAVNSEYIKSGSVNRSERLAKYNRLLEIETQLK